MNPIPPEEAHSARIMMVTYVDTYIHIHTYVYIYIYICIHIYIYMYTHMHVYICIYVYIILGVIVFFSSLSFYGEWTIPGTKRQPAILNLIDGVFLISSLPVLAWGRNVSQIDVDG